MVPSARVKRLLCASLTIKFAKINPTRQRRLPLDNAVLTDAAKRCSRSQFGSMKLHNRNFVGVFSSRTANLNHVGAIIQTNDHLKSIYFAFGVRILHESVIMETLQNKLLILSNHSAMRRRFTTFFGYLCTKSNICTAHS